MSAGTNNDKKKRTFLSGCCDGTFEIIKDCFPDDAGYSASLSRMNGDGRRFCDQEKEKNNENK